MIDMQQSEFEWRVGGVKAAESYFDGEKSAAQRAMNWIEQLADSVPFASGMPIIEHSFGVLPSLREFDGRSHNAAVLETLRRGKVLASLALFTPTPDFSWSAAAMRATSRSERSIVSGSARIGSVASDWSVVLIRDTEQTELHRLALVAHQQSGVTRARSKDAGQSAVERGEWLILREVVVEPSFLSSPVTVVPGGDYRQTLDEYAAAFALTASLYAQRAITAARSVLRLGYGSGKPFNTSQVLAMGTTEIEIPIQFALSAARTYFRSDPPNRSSGVVLAAAASRLVRDAHARLAEVLELSGVSGDTVSVDSDCATTRMACGGVQLIESEVAHTMGI